uniref:Uncharacterized protein n=1 Tax=viral metagenome TaxID=1070528 RepID=A0A6M3XNT0_9ZZZZ
MANRIEFSVSCTPVVSVAVGENVAVDTIANDMQKSLGGSGAVASGEIDPSVTVTFNTFGYTANTVSYRNINTSATTTSFGDVTLFDFCIIKHTGRLYSDATTLGIATTMAIDIYVGTQIICCIRPGEAIVLPLRGKVATITMGARLQSGTTGVALEVFFTG